LQDSLKIPDPLLSEWISPEDIAHPELESSPLALGAAISRSANKWGDRDAVIFRHQPAIEDVAWTYDDLNDLTSRRWCIGQSGI